MDYSVLIDKKRRRFQELEEEIGGGLIFDNAGRAKDILREHARLKELGLAGFAAPITGVNCTDHNGHGSAFMQQWDGTKWVKITDWITPMKDVVRPMLEQAAEDYVTKATGWPKRTESCDKSS